MRKSHQLLTSTHAAELAEEILQWTNDPEMECALVSLMSTALQGLMFVNQEKSPEEISSTIAAHLARDPKISVPKKMLLHALETLHFALPTLDQCGLVEIAAHHADPILDLFVPHFVDLDRSAFSPETEPDAYQLEESDLSSDKSLPKLTSEC
jgi:hypothetical protein